MSYYFRPPNSREQNLFIVRFSVDDLDVANFTNAAPTYTLNTSAYTSPAYIFLPAGLFLRFNTSTSIFTLDYTNAKYEVPPTLNLLMKDIDPPTGFNVSILSVTSTQAQFIIYTGYTSAITTVIPSTTTFTDVGLQVQVIGRTTTGPTFAIANQGWTYVESTTVNTDTIYTTMNMGTSGVTQPPYGLSVGGTFGYQGSAGTVTNGTAIANYKYSDISSIASLLYAYYPLDLTIGLSAGANAVTLPTPANVGQEIKFQVVVNPNAVTNTITFTGQVVGFSGSITSVGDTMTFISAYVSGALKWVKVNNQ
ncbi:MAG: hypothetical protein RL736_1023 [Pseudomonadota bacterium]